MALVILAVRPALGVTHGFCHWAMDMQEPLPRSQDLSSQVGQYWILVLFNTVVRNRWSNLPFVYIGPIGICTVYFCIGSNVIGSIDDAIASDERYAKLT